MNKPRLISKNYEVLLEKHAENIARYIKSSNDEELQEIIKQGANLIEEYSGWSLGEHVYQVETSGEYFLPLTPAIINGVKVVEKTYKFDEPTTFTTAMADLSGMMQILYMLTARLYFHRGDEQVSLEDILRLLSAYKRVIL